MHIVAAASSMEIKGEPLAWNILVPHLKNLRTCGVYQLDPTSRPVDRFLHGVYMRISVSVSIVYALQEIVYMYHVRSNTDKVIDSMFLLLSFFDSIYKQLVFSTKSQQIEKLMDILKGTRFNQNVPYQKKELLERAARAKVILRVYNSLTLTTCVLWTLFPLLLHLKGQDIEFAIWLPFDPNRNSIHFFVAILYNYLQTSFLGFNDSSMDSFASVFLSQCKTQLSFLRNDLEQMVENSQQLAKKRGIPYQKAFDKLFVNALLHYGDIVTLAENTLDVFGGAILFQFLVTGWIICTTAYRAINMNPASVEFFSMIFYMSCILVQIFLYCYYGNEITFESLRLSESAYKLNWLETTPRQQRALIIYMERIKRPIEPKAGLIIPLSASTFITILRSSYTFYTVLKTTE